MSEFSKAVGVSPATVSNALRGRGRMTDETRAMIHRRARELGFAPNAHAQRMMQRRSMIAAIHHTDQGLLGDPFLMEFTRGVQKALSEARYGLLLDTESHLDDEDSLLWGYVKSKAIDGAVIIQGWSPIEPGIRRLATARTPIVAYGGAPARPVPHAAFVGPDFTAGVEEMADHLIALGHRRIGYIGMPHDDMHEKFRVVLHRRGLSLPGEMVVNTGFGATDGARAFTILMGQRQPPTAIFVRRDEQAVGALFEARNRGIRVPQDVSIASHDDVPMAQLVDPPLTTIRFDVYAIGHTAASTLLRMIEDPELAPERLLMGNSLVVRGTTGPGPQA